MEIQYVRTLIAQPYSVHEDRSQVYARYEIRPIPNRKQIQNAPLHVAVNKREDIT